jgi:6,7-dimethyl-8-ribityllumazine synthase
MKRKHRPPAIAIVAAQFNRELVEAMIASATDEAEAAHARVVEVVRVPGSYEVPLVAEAVLARKDVDAIVVLGFIERGETMHGEVMAHVVHGAVVQSSLTHGKPVGFGVIGPGATAEQAEARKDSYARAAMRAALATIAVVSRARSRSSG